MKARKAGEGACLTCLVWRSWPKAMAVPAAAWLGAGPKDRGRKPTLQSRKPKPLPSGLRSLFPLQEAQPKISQASLEA